MISRDRPQMGPGPMNSFFKMTSRALWAPGCQGVLHCVSGDTQTGPLREAGLQARLLESGGGGSREPSSSAGQ